MKRLLVGRMLRKVRTSYPVLFTECSCESQPQAIVVWLQTGMAECRTCSGTLVRGQVVGKGYDYKGRTSGGKGAVFER